ncbi:MAG: proliferating cell nuclear antigen (pcna) [Candidatus Marsarchaeota archaeon]|jgi:proliferating cell nuclear antigen|nr:proliferating cell nuclear antigen (pcna) [Candidatus Marsarchaeota archaeon]
MFEIKIDDAKYWKNCVDAIVKLVDEGSFDISKEGITLRAMDPSGISMVSFSIPNKAFSKYDVDKQMRVGLNLENLDRILASARGDEQLLMKDSGGRFLIEFIGKHSRRRYKLPMIETKKDIDKEPKVEFESEMEVRGESIKEIIKDAALLSTYIGFKTDKSSFTVMAKGDMGELEEEHLGSADVIKNLVVKSPSSATFNLEYLDRMVSACPSGNQIKMSFKSNEPIMINYKIGDAEVIYFLAPYMED